MSATNSFTDKENKYTLHAKPEFFVECPNPQNYNILELLSTYKLSTYLHNQTGPAIIRNSDGFKEYWLNGNRLSKEQAERIQHNVDHRKTMLEELGVTE